LIDLINRVLGVGVAGVDVFGVDVIEKLNELF